MRTNQPRWRQPLLFQPVETIAPFSFSTVLEEARAVWFPELAEAEIEVRLASVSALASVWYHRMGWERHIVVFHPVLNRPEVPIEVVRFIAKHELTHLVVREPGHPNAFWQRELEVGPERFAVWSWIRTNLGRGLSHNRFGVSVRRDWRTKVPACFAPYTPHLPFDDPPWPTLCPDGGAQLRFDPTWSHGPAPLSAPQG
jgi:hypothetical protein